jgi:hypothetical protein
MHNRSSHERAAKISIPRHANTSVTNQEIENTQRRDEISTSLFYPFTADPMSNQVRWLSNSIDGPYAGKLERLTKCALQLENDSSSAFYMFYASLKAFITGCGFNEELLQSLLLIAGSLDLTKTPIGLDNFIAKSPKLSL